MGIPKSDLLGVTMAVIHVAGQQSAGAWYMTVANSVVPLPHLVRRGTKFMLPCVLQAINNPSILFIDRKSFEVRKK